MNLYVALASELDDGEAMALAIAKQRSWTLATDDRKAGRLAGDLGVDVVTTPEVMRRWAESRKVPSVEIRKALRNVEFGARFVPSRKMPDYDWWIACVEND